MRILFDLVHPADVLFFYWPIKRLQEDGHQILLVSRFKDVTCQLLDDFELPHTPVSKAGNGILGLAIELIARDLAVLSQARRFKPDIMVGFGGVSISHVGKLLGIKTLAFYDSENARLQTSITWPFIDHLCVPQSYQGNVPLGRTTRFPGVKELSYLHPNNFTPDQAIAERNGIDPKRKNYLVRVVKWRANHDLGKTGIAGSTLLRLVDTLSAKGNVIISSEVTLPEELENYRYRGSVTEIHHLMAHCDLVIGESATMASEAAVLGTPAIYCGRDFPGYIRELETVGLVKSILPEEIEPKKMLIQLCEFLHDHSKFHKDYIQSSTEWVSLILSKLLTIPNERQ